MLPKPLASSHLSARLQSRGAMRIAAVVAVAAAVAFGLAARPIRSAFAGLGTGSHSALPPGGDTVAVYGPRQFATPTGSAQYHVERIGLAVTPGKRYTLRVTNGAPDGSGRVTGGGVELNGWEILSDAELAAGGPGWSRVVQARSEDTLEVTVAGPAGAHLTAELLESADASFLVFGFERFVRTSGTPVTETRTFSISPTAAAPYRLCIINGNEDGSDRISSATIVLNGVEIVSSNAFNQQVASLMREVSLVPGENVLEVTLAATPHGFLDLCVTATDVTPPTLTITAPAPGFVTNAAQVLVTGTVQDETPTAVTVNGVVAERTGAGYSATVPLAVEGNNLITVSAVDAAGLQTDSTRTVIRDTQAPIVTVNSPPDGLITNQATLTVSGTVSDLTAVTVNANGVPLPVDGAGAFSGEITLAEGATVVSVTATDAATNSSTVVRIVTLDTQAPVIAWAEPADGATVTTDAVAISGTVTDATAVTLTANGAPIPVAPDGTFSGSVPLVLGPNTITLVATDAATNSAAQTRTVTRQPAGPPDPLTVATPLFRAEATLMQENTAFLYTGANPVQTGVVEGTIQLLRAAVIRGRVLTRALEPLPGVVVAIKDQPELGQTLTRSDGRYDLAVNGGGTLVLDFGKAGYLPVQRGIAVAWQDYTLVDDVILLQPDPAVTLVDLASTEIQVARATVQSDSDGPRQATVFFEPGTQATLTRPDGTTEALTTLSVRATEFTVGENGLEAMPAELPPASQYTYAVQITTDEQLAAGAGAVVEFSQPALLYVENFLEFPVGTAVPTGAYDVEAAAWQPRPNGMVLQILGTDAQGRALLDINGDGVPDSDSLLVFNGIDPLERVRLAGTYPDSSELWRVPIIETLPYDLNWPFVLVGGQAPQSEVTGPCGSEGADVLRCNLQVQTAFQAVGIVGSPFTLNYASDRTQGTVAERRLEIALIGDTVPPFLERVDLEIDIVGRRFEAGFLPEPNLSYTFTWDGLDAYGRPVQQTQPANVRISYLYPVLYGLPAAVTQSFGLPCTATSGSCALELDDSVRTAIRALRRVAQTIPTTLGGFDATGAGLGGFTFDVQHAYDPIGGQFFAGDGTRRVAATLPEQVTRFAGGAASACHLAIGDGGLATNAFLFDPAGIAVAPDGSVYIADRPCSRVRKVSPDGVITTVAGTGTAGFSGDGGPATQAQLVEPRGIALGPDGSLYIVDHNNQRIRRVGPDGIITTFAGDGNFGFAGDGGPATAARFFNPIGIAVGPDGSVYVADQGNRRIRRIGTDGIITTFAGTGAACFTTSVEAFCGTGIPATRAQLDFPRAVAVAPDGTVYFSQGGNESARVRRVAPDGLVYSVAGSANPPTVVGDGGPALQATFSAIWALTVGPDGSVYVAEEGNPSDLPHFRIRRVRPDGLITTFVGDGVQATTGTGGTHVDNVPARRARVLRVEGLAFGQDGSLYFADDGKVRKVSPVLPGLVAGQTVIASADGRQLFVFSPAGRHLLTLHGVTRDTLYRFIYNASRQLVSVVDGQGRTLRIERDSAGRVTGIIAPDGQATSLTLDAAGNLATIRDPAGTGPGFGYGSGSLLSELIDPRGGGGTYAYDTEGRLTGMTGPEGASLVVTQADSNVTLSAGVWSTTLDATYLTTGTRSLSNTLPSGLALQTTVDPAGRTEAHFPDGTITIVTERPDPRFGLQTPLREETVRTPSGLTLSRRAGRGVFLSDLLDPSSVVRQIDSLLVNGRVKTEDYDFVNKRVTTRTPGGRRSTTTLDTRGRVVQLSVAGLAATNYDYDSLGRLATIRQGSRVIRYDYDSAGQLAVKTDPVGRQTVISYDFAGQPTQRTLPGGRVIVYDHDPSGNLIELTPPGRSAYRFHYNSRNQLTGYEGPDVGTGATISAIDRDSIGQVIRVRRADSNNVSISYDEAGRRSTMTHSGGVVGFEYDSLTGVLKGVSVGAVALRKEYDGPLPTRMTWSGPITGSTQLSYDNDFRISSVGVNDGTATPITYDGDGLPIAVGSLVINRDSLSSQLRGTALGGVSTSTSYDSLGQTTHLLATSGSAVLYAATYTRDTLGRVVQIVEDVQGQQTAYQVSYDSAGRVIAVIRDGAPMTSYDYDLNNNRVSETTPNGTVVASYDAQDRVVAYGQIAYRYTPYGDLNLKIVGADTTTYQYDPLGNLLRVNLPDGREIAFVIDGENRRIGKRVNGALVQAFLYGHHQQPIAELGPSNEVVSQFFYGAGALAPDYMTKGGRTYRIVVDHLGSVRLVVDIQSGDVAQRIDYDIFGRVLTNTNPGFQPFGFAGGLLDSETEFVRFGVRDYDPTVGRWTTRDPSGFSSGEPNLYVYASADPVNATDPTGTASLLEVVTSAEVRAAGQAAQWAGAFFGCAGEVVGYFLERPEDQPPDYLTLGAGCLKGAVIGGVLGRIGGTVGATASSIGLPMSFQLGIMCVTGAISYAGVDLAHELVGADYGAFDPTWGCIGGVVGTVVEGEFARVAPALSNRFYGAIVGAFMGGVIDYVGKALEAQMEALYGPDFACKAYPMACP